MVGAAQCQAQRGTLCMKSAHLDGEGWGAGRYNKITVAGACAQNLEHTVAHSLNKIEQFKIIC